MILSTCRSIRLRISSLNFNWNTRAIRFERFWAKISNFKSRWNSSQSELQMKVIKYADLSNFRINVRAFCFFVFMYRELSTWLEDNMMTLLSMLFNSYFSFKRFITSKYKSTRSFCWCVRIQLRLLSSQQA